MKLFENGFYDLICAIFSIVIIIFCGNAIGINLPHEMPKIKSIALEKFIPKDKNKGVDINKIKEQNGLAKMFVTYNLAAAESSQNRQFDVKNDLWLFFDIIDALPNDIVIPMFRFNDDTIEIDFNGDLDSLESFCNELAKTGNFTTITYKSQDGFYIIEVKRI